MSFEKVDSTLKGIFGKCSDKNEKMVEMFHKNFKHIHISKKDFEEFKNEFLE